MKMPLLINFDKDKDAKPKTSSFGSDTAPMPKHIPFPEVSGNSEIMCELVITSFTLASAILQFINVYRTNWWMEESYVHHAVDLKSINMDLVNFIVISTTRRLFYLLLLRLMAIMNLKLSKQYMKIIKYIFAFGFFCVIGLIKYKVYKVHTMLFAAFLSYPIVIYFLIFGFKLEPFLRPFWEIDGAYFNGMPFHSCSMNPINIRDEIEILKLDYNRRFQQVLFTSMSNAYYAGFIPLCTPTGPLFNAAWTGQHLFFVWLTNFMMGAVFLFPSKYIDVLHRASLHLGCWQKVPSHNSSNHGNAHTSNSNNNATAAFLNQEQGINDEEKMNGGAGCGSDGVMTWNKNWVWTENSFVKYNNQYYKSLTPFTASWPGNKSHYRFYKFFHAPERIFLYMFCGEGLIIMAHMLLLFFSIEWHYMLSICFISFTNQFVFFRIARDFLVTKRVYTTESAITEKHYE